MNSRYRHETKNDMFRILLNDSRILVKDPKEPTFNYKVTLNLIYSY